MTIESDLVLAEAERHVLSAKERGEEEDLRIRRERELGILAQQTRAELLSVIGKIPNFSDISHQQDDGTITWGDGLKNYSLRLTNRENPNGVIQTTKLTSRLYSSDGNLLMKQNVILITRACRIGESEELAVISGGIHYQSESADALSRKEDSSNDEATYEKIIGAIQTIQ